MSIQYQNPPSPDLILDAESQGGSPEAFRERVIPCAGLSGGCSLYHAVAAGSGDEDVIAAGPGQVYAVHAFSVRSTVLFIKFHNTTSTPTAGTTPVVMSLAAQAGLPRDVIFPLGVEFDTGIAISITAGIADDDATGVTAGDVTVDVLFKA